MGTFKGFLQLVSLLTVACLPQVASAAGVVTTNTESALIAAMAGGGTVTFGFNGTIYLTNALIVSNDTVLDATGQIVRISGSGGVQILVVNPGATLLISNLTLSDGLATGSYVFEDGLFFYSALGGAISNAGVLQAYGCTLTNNEALGPGGTLEDVPTSGNSDALGGAVYNLGVAQMTGCIFMGNSATGGAAVGPHYFGGNGAGGAFYNANQAVFTDCIFSNNIATGGDGSIGSGFVYNFNPGPGGPAGEACGGAVCNTGNLTVSCSTFAQNGAVGGTGGQGGSGASFTYEPGQSGFVGGAAADANGGALCATSGAATLVNCTFWGNSAIGGSGGSGGNGGLAFVNTYSGGDGGNGAAGANAYGGAISGNGGMFYMTNITVASNTIEAGAGGMGGQGTNGGAMGTNGLPGSAMGCSVANVGATNVLKNSILSADVSTDTNIFGPLIDAGNNISFDDQDSLTNSTSYNGINPLLAPLGNYGGLTPTMALLPGSPAIDHADVHSFPPTDQRGHPRPYGPAPDIGAFEYAPANTLISGAYSYGQLHLAYQGTNGQSYRIQTSVNFSQWYPIATNTIGVSGYQDLAYAVTNFPYQYFRAVSP